MSRPNPFERYDLDPLASAAAITERFRELSASAADEAEQSRLREEWQRLTLAPADRLGVALAAHPETRLPLGPAPVVPRPAAAADEPRLALRDLCPLPSIAACLGPWGEGPLASGPRLHQDPELAAPPQEKP